MKRLDKRIENLQVSDIINMFPLVLDQLESCMENLSLVIEDIDTGDWFSVGGCYKESQMLLDQIRELNEKKLYEGTI